MTAPRPSVHRRRTSAGTAGAAWQRSDAAGPAAGAGIQGCMTRPARFREEGAGMPNSSDIDLILSFGFSVIGFLGMMAAIFQWGV